jgi:hypothetical protein
MAPWIKSHSHGNAETLPKRPCVLLWDESFLWGVMAWRALREAGLPFDLIRAEDIREGGLCGYRMLFVPGGWASNKMDALGERGREEIRRFVAAGGSYLGICGGAGMATEDGLDLLPIRRRPSSERVPSFSGRIRLSCTEHMIWQDIGTPVFCAWWPSQFRIADSDVHVLARYEDPQMDAFSSDINVADGGIAGWSGLEQRYGIFLDPARLRGEPAVVEGRLGHGRVILSLVHFDTPGDRDGAVVLKNLWTYLSSDGSARSETGTRRAEGQSGPDFPQEVVESACECIPGGLPRGKRVKNGFVPLQDRRFSAESCGELQLVREIQTAAADLIETGTRNFLWYWRNALFLHWRRGVRGLEYSTLAVMVAEIRRLLEPDCLGYSDMRRGLPDAMDPSRLHRDLVEIRRQIVPFATKARCLLVRERFYMQKTPLSPLVCDDEEIRRLRQELFGSTMSHGGDYKCLIDAVEGLLYKLIRRV